MKTKLKKLSKRTISIILSLVMLVSMAVVGIITVNAYQIYDENLYFIDTNKWGSAEFFAWDGSSNQVANADMQSCSNTGGKLFVLDYNTGVNDFDHFNIRKKNDWNNSIGDKYTDIKSRKYYAGSDGPYDLSTINGKAKVITKIQSGSTYSTAASSSCTATVAGYYKTNDGTWNATSTNKSTSSSSSSAEISAIYGSTITYTASVSGSTYVFKGFSTTDSSSLPTTLYSSGTTATADKYNGASNTTYYAYFALAETKYNVTVNAGSNGSVKVNDAAHTSGNNISVGTITKKKVEAVPATGYTFNNWTVTGGVTNAGAALADGSTTNPLLTVGATAAGTLTANFTEKATQTVTISAPANGSVTVTGSSVSGNSSVTANSGDASDTTLTAHVDDVLTITATPDTHCRLTSLTAAGQIISSGDTYTVAAGVDPTIDAEFEYASTYRIKVFAGTGGTTQFKSGSGDGDFETITANTAKNYDVPWEDGYTVKWTTSSGYTFSKTTKNGSTASTTDNSSLTGTNTDDGAVYKTEWATAWPPSAASGLSESINDKIIYVDSTSSNDITNNNVLDSSYVKANSDQTSIWVDFTSLLPLSSNNRFYFGLSSTSSYTNFYCSSTSTVSVTSTNAPGVAGGSLTNKDSRYYFAQIWGDNDNKLSDLTHLGCLITIGSNNKFTFTIYSSTSSSSATDSSYDPFYIGGRFVTSSTNTGEYGGDFDIDSTKIKFTSKGNNRYSLATGKTVAELSAELYNSARTETNPQYFIIHDTASFYAAPLADFSGNSFQNHLGYSNALTIIPTATNNILPANEMMFDDVDNTSNGLVTLWIDAKDYAEGNSASSLKVWYEVTGETPAVADELTFSVSPQVLTVNQNATLTATISDVNSRITDKNAQLQFVFEKYNGSSWGAVATVTGSDITNPSTGKYRATTTVTNATAGNYTYRVTVSTVSKEYSGIALRSISKSASAAWNPQTVYYTSDISSSTASPTWTAVDPAGETQDEFATITTTVASGGSYTIALSDTNEYNPDFADFTIASEYNQFCDINIGSKTVTIDNEDRVVRTYVVTPNANCKNPTIYIDSATNKIYAVATYSGDSTTKTTSESKTVTYYFAERVANSSGTAVDDYKKSNPNSSTNDGMKIKYWNNSTGKSAEANVTTAVNVNGSNVIYVSTKDLFRQNPTTLGSSGYNRFKVYKVNLPIWATSFRFLTSSSGQFNAVPTYTADDYNVNHSITLNPNRIYLLYQNKATVDISKDEDWTVKGVILDESMWSSSRTTAGNEVVTKSFTTNLVNYKDLSGLENQNNGINNRLQTLYNSDNYNTPNALYFGYISSRQSWTGMSTDRQWAQSNAQRKSDNSYFASVQNMVGATLTTLGTSVGSKGTYGSTTLNANGFGMMLDTRGNNSKGIKNANLMPLFDYTSLASDTDAASVVKQGLSFPFYQSTYNGITTYSYDSTTDRNRVYDTDSENFKVQTANDNKGYGVTGMQTGADSNGKGYAGFFPFGGNTDKYTKTGFATEFDLNFYMTNSGYLVDSDGVSEDIAFNFSGDDDVWVYVDGVKVLDLGGDHKVSAATINFSEGKVYYKSAANDINNVSGCTDSWATDDSYVKTVDLVKLMDSYGVTFSKTDAATKHTFQMFYMERGAFQSNCVISFNLPQASGLNIRNNVLADNVNAGLKNAALAASNTDYFTYELGNKTAIDSDIETLRGVAGYENALLPSSTGTWSASNAYPKYPYNYDITRVFGGDSLILGSSSTSIAGQTGGSVISSLTNSWQYLKNSVFTLSDKYAQSSASDAKLSGISDSETGEFHLLGGEMANFTDKIRPNSYVQVYQNQNLGFAEPDSTNNNIIKFKSVSDNNIGNYYTTSFDIYDEAAKKNIVDETSYNIDYTDNHNYYAYDASATSEDKRFYFTNYAGDSGNINPAMTVNFYNNIAVGSLKVSKEVTNSATANENFYFKVEFSQMFGDTTDGWSEYDIEYRVYNIEDDTPVSMAKQSYGTVGIVIKPGQYALIEGVPVETRFRVTEMARAGYSVVNVDKTAVKPNNDQISTITNGPAYGFYNYLNQGGVSTIKDDHTFTDTSGYTYYCNMIPIVSESHVSGTNDYVSLSSVMYYNKKENFTIQFKYYDRYAISGTTAGINSSATTYSKPIESIPAQYITYVDGDEAKGVQSIDFARLIAAYATEFSNDTLNVSNVMCKYKLWTSQSAAVTGMGSETYFDDGTATAYTDAEKPYHTSYLGRPNTSGEKWVSYYDGKNVEIEEANITKPSDYLSVRTIVVWCYNYPKEYDVDVYGADDAADLVSKTVDGQAVYVANGETTTSKSINNKFYYNQRFGYKTGSGSQDEAGFISNYGIPGTRSDVQPVNYASETFGSGDDTYTFAYWAYDQAGTQVASVDRSFMYRVTTKTKLYAVYTKGGAYGTTPGVSLSANNNDTYVDSNGVSRTRLNILASVYNAVPYDTNTQKLAFVNISLSSQIRTHPETYTPAKINSMFEQYKNQLKSIIEAHDASVPFSLDYAYNGHVDDTINLILTTKGYVYTVVSNGNEAAQGDSVINLTNKNRAQFTISYKTSALNADGTNTNGNTCLMYSGALKYNGQWSISNNCLIYYNGHVVDNTAGTWS